MLKLYFLKLFSNNILLSFVINMLLSFITFFYFISILFYFIKQKKNKIFISFLIILNIIIELSFHSHYYFHFILFHLTKYIRLTLHILLILAEEERKPENNVWCWEHLQRSAMKEATVRYKFSKAGWYMCPQNNFFFQTSILPTFFKKINK